MGIYKAVKIYDPEGKAMLSLNRNDYIRQRVEGFSVLHIGCADFPITEARMRSGTLLHLGLAECCKYLVGIDNSIEGLKILKKMGLSEIVAADAGALCLKENFDYIISGDVLEHLSNAGMFIGECRRLLKANGRLIIGVPNAFSFNIIRYLLGREPTHKDHTYYFSVKCLCELCSRYGLLPTKIVFTTQARERYEAKWYIMIRDFLVKVHKRLAPSLIMEFMLNEHVDATRYYEWH
jgi:SAM-dependent methyltransferase